MDKPTAFDQWLYKATEGDRDLIAVYLMREIGSGRDNAQVWDYLHETGEQVYNREAFYKAANLVLDKFKGDLDG
jgi:hypothetical protein